MGELGAGARLVASSVGRRTTMAGIAVTTTGVLAAAVVLLVLGPRASALALVGLVVVVGLALLGVGLWAPRSVGTDQSGLRVSRGVTDRFVPWASVRRVRGNGQGMVDSDTHLELVDGGLVELPGGVRMGTVERWRRETGGAIARPERGDARSWPLSRPTLYWPGVFYLPFVLNWFLDGWNLLLGLLPVALVAVLLYRRPRPKVVATAGGLSVPTWRGRRDVAWQDIEEVRGRSDRWDFQRTLQRRDGTTVDLPVGLTPDVVEMWRTELSDSAEPDQD